MKNKYFKRIVAVMLAMGMVVSLTACGGKSTKKLNSGEFQEVDKSELEFPLKETTTLTGMTSYPANTESNPNNRTIFKRLQEKTNGRQSSQTSGEIKLPSTCQIRTL